MDLKLEPLRTLEFFKTGTFEGLSNVKLDRFFQIEFSENLNLTLIQFTTIPWELRRFPGSLILPEGLSGWVNNSHHYQLLMNFDFEVRLGLN